MLTDEGARLIASTDWAHMSPVLEPMLPGGVADVVVCPRDAAGIAAAVGAAHRHRVPVTVRGQGTGNYGQGIPLYGGLVIDTSRANRVISVGDGEITAEAGASFVMLEKAARATGPGAVDPPVHRRVHDRRVHRRRVGRHRLDRQRRHLGRVHALAARRPVHRRRHPGIRAVTRRTRRWRTRSASAA